MCSLSLSLSSEASPPPRPDHTGEGEGGAARPAARSRWPPRGGKEGCTELGRREASDGGSQFVPRLAVLRRREEVPASWEQRQAAGRTGRRSACPSAAAAFSRFSYWRMSPTMVGDLPLADELGHLSRGATGRELPDHAL
jgi:hypothetical protein